VRVLFLDVDGVLNRTGFRPAESVGLRSWIEPDLAQRLCEVIHRTGAALVMASDWRLHRELDELRDELRAAGIDGTLVGTTPELQDQPRWREIEAWMVQHSAAREAIVIVDDLHDMGPLGARFVRTSPLNGLDDAAAQAIVALYEA
jgi:Swiss Army Knife RNA repair-like protein